MSLLLREHNRIATTGGSIETKVKRDSESREHQSIEILVVKEAKRKTLASICEIRTFSPFDPENRTLFNPYKVGINSST